MDQYITTLKQLNEKYELKMKNETAFDNQKEIVNILLQIGSIVDKMHWLNKSTKTTHSNKLESLCEEHDWEIDRSMWDGHTSRCCTKCDKYV